MKAIKLLGITFLTVFFLVSCKKNKEPLTPQTGIYRGVFDRVFADGDSSGTGVVFLALSEGPGSFTLEGDTLSLVPVSSSGTYELMEDSKISFNNTAAIDGELWDPYYILDTLWEYEFTDTSFLMNLKLDTVSYYYNLSRF